MNVIGLIKEIGIKLGNRSFLPRLGSSLISIPHRFQYRGSNNGSINVAETGIRLVHLVRTFFAHFAIFTAHLVLPYPTPLKTSRYSWAQRVQVRHKLFKLGRNDLSWLERTQVTWTKLGRKDSNWA